MEHDPARPDGPLEGPDTEQDTFVFSQGEMEVGRGLEQLAANLSGMTSERRRHLFVAMAGVGATWLALPLAARRLRRKRRQRRLRQRQRPRQA